MSKKKLHAESLIIKATHAIATLCADINDRLDEKEAAGSEELWESGDHERISYGGDDSFYDYIPEGLRVLEVACFALQILIPGEDDITELKKAVQDEYKEGELYLMDASGPAGAVIFRLLKKLGVRSQNPDEDLDDYKDMTDQQILALGDKDPWSNYHKI